MSDTVVKWVVGIIAALLILWIVTDDTPSCYEGACPEYDYGNNPGIMGR